MRPGRRFGVAGQRALGSPDRGPVPAQAQTYRRIRPVIPRIGDGGGRPRVTGTVAGWTRSRPRLATASSDNRAAVQAVWCPCGGCVETGATAGAPSAGRIRTMADRGDGGTRIGNAGRPALRVPAGSSLPRLIRPSGDYF